MVEVSHKDTSPQAFMEDRIKQIAVTRLEQAIQYINDRPRNNTNFVDGDVVTAILEGTYVEPETTQERDREVPDEKPEQDSIPF